MCDTKFSKNKNLLCFISQRSSIAGNCCSYYLWMKKSVRCCSLKKSQEVDGTNNSKLKAHRQSLDVSVESPLNMKAKDFIGDSVECQFEK